MNIYVGNLPYSVRNDELREAFEQFGNVTSAEVIFDRRTKRSRGYGFVEMDNDSDARKAIDRGRDLPPGVDSSSLLGNVGLAGRLVPSIRGLRIIRTWAGMNTTMDGASAIGRLPGERRIITAVPGDAGYTLGPLVARMASSIALDQTPPEDPLPYDPARFA